MPQWWRDFMIWLDTSDQSAIILITFLVVLGVIGMLAKREDRGS